MQSDHHLYLIERYFVIVMTYLKQMSIER